MLCDAENLYNVSDSNLGNILSYETGLYRSGKHGEKFMFNHWDSETFKFKFETLTLMVVPAHPCIREFNSLYIAQQEFNSSRPHR